MAVGRIARKKHLQNTFDFYIRVNASSYLGTPEINIFTNLLCAHLFIYLFIYLYICMFQKISTYLLKINGGLYN